MAVINYTAEQITKMLRDAVVAQETVGTYGINKYVVPNYNNPSERSIGEATIFQGDPANGLVYIEPNTEAQETGEEVADWHNSLIFSCPPWQPRYEETHYYVPLSLGKYKFKLMTALAGDSIDFESRGIEIKVRLWGRPYTGNSFDVTIDFDDEYEFEVTDFERYDLDVSIIVIAHNGCWRAGYEGFYVYPLLCRAEIFEAYSDDDRIPRIPYIPDLQTQILKSGGGYNEVQTSRYTDNVQEVTV